MGGINKLYFDEGANPENMGIKESVELIERLKAERDAYNRLIVKMEQQILRVSRNDVERNSKI